MIVTITNQKGGVGKTTTAHTLCCGLVKRGYSVLAIDTDPQTNLTFTAGITPDMVEADLYDIFRGEKTAAAAILQAGAGFAILPGSLGLAGADMEFSHTGREYLLKEAIEPIKKNYDFIVIDTPPTLGILTVNALTASDRVIVPMCADIYSLQGLSQLQGMITNVRKYSNSSLVIDGLLLTKYSPRAIINRQLKEAMLKVSKQLETKLYKTPIREAVAVKEIQFMQSNIFTEYPEANVTADYKAFIDEFLKGLKQHG